MAQLSDGTFSKTGNPDEFNDVKNNLMYHDRYYTMADYDAYIAAQDKVNETYKVPINCVHFLKKSDCRIHAFIFQKWELWAKMAIINVASSGKFSSDRTIAEYGREIWGVEPNYEALPDPHESQSMK